MNHMRIDPNYTTSKNGKHRKELKTVLRSIYDSLGPIPATARLWPRCTSVATSAASKCHVNSCGHSGTRTENRGGSREIRNIVIVCSVMYLPMESGIENQNITEIVLSLGNSSYSQNSPFLSTFSTPASPRRFVSIMAEQAICPTP